jgi:hypothetical protein
LECGKNDLWFYHPEFAKMSSGVRVFSSESWSKGVDISHTVGKGFNVKLSTHTKESSFTKHIFFVINLLLLEWNWSEVKEITFFWLFFLLLLFFLAFLWFFTSSEIFSCFLFLGFFLLDFFKGFGVSDFFKFSFGLWSLGVSLKSSHFADWFVRMWKSSGNSKHFSSTFAIRSSDNWSMDVLETSSLEESMSSIC